MTDLSPLSPAAQAVAWAYDNTPEKETGNHRYHWLAAALRAAADKLSQEVDAPKVDGMKYAGIWHSFDYLQVIAAELEGADG